MAETFRVALSGDFLNAHGQPAFPDFDLGPLEREPNLEFVFLPRERGGDTIRAEDLEGFDALILLVPRITDESFPGDGRLAVIARFGVGFDTVDVDTCTANGYRVAAAVTWTITFVATGPVPGGGPLPSRTTSTDVAYPVNEVRSFLGDGDGPS